MKKLYIAHGWTYTIKPWDKTVEILKSNGIEVIQLKVPGLTSPSDKVWNIDEYVEWLMSNIKNDSDFTLIGHSNGGRIALNTLSKYPDAIPNLILLNSAGVYVNPDVVSLKRKVFRVIAKVGKPVAKIPIIRKVFYRVIGGSDYEKAPENMKKTLHNMLESDKNLNLKNIKTKTSILWGKEDKITPIGMGRKIHQELKNSTLKEFEEWKHAPYITHPEELAKEILEILK